MLAVLHRVPWPAALLAGLFWAVLLLLPASFASASWLVQGGGLVDISEQECSFWLDYDDDGEGDAVINTGPDSYARQETPVVGGCSFKLNTDAETTLVVVTELVDWSSEVEITREPGLPQRMTLHPGRTEIPGLSGGMRISVSHTGMTPRSGKTRALPDDFTHEVQIPRSFRLLEVTVTAADGTKDRLEENVQSATSAYIDTHAHLSDRVRRDDAAAPDVAAALAAELLEDGYPQLADRVLKLEVSLVESGGVNLWMWSTIGIIVVVVTLAIGFVVFQFLNRRAGNQNRGRNRTPTRPRNM